MILKIVLRRIALMVPILLIVLLIVNLLIYLSPGDPAYALAGEEATAEQVEAIRQALGLNQSPVERYFNFLLSAARGDLGESLFYFRPVTDLIASALPATLSVAVVTILFVAILGVGLGLLAALNQDTIIDRSITVVTSVILAVPSFIVAIALVIVFAVTLPVLPAVGFVPLSDGVGPWLIHLILPALALATSPIAEVARQTRGAVVDVSNQDFIRTAQAKGLSDQRVIFKHVAKNAAISVVTVIGLQLGGILGGVVIIESVFVLPGLGALSFGAVTRGDYPLLQGIVLVSAVMILVVNLLTDLTYYYFNPKLRS